MATITSAGTGNWSSTSTWVGGSVPAADDLVIIAHGHKVTLNTNIQATRTGNVTIDGNLYFSNGGKMHLHGRMAVNNTSHSGTSSLGEFVQGTAASGSLLSMSSGTEIKISGSNADQHGIQVRSRKWCGVELLGGEPTLITQTNGVHSPNSSYITVDSATNFVAGDLISLYRREVDYRIAPDECFYVHDIDASNNRIYFKHFVGPEGTVISKNGSTIKVDDASLFRVGYKVLFGTGSNRNAKEITGISGDTITFESSVSGTVDNLKIYRTGTEKPHPNDTSVRRTATSLTTAITALDSTNQITVGNAADFSVGDEIAVEAASDTYSYVSGEESNYWRHNLLYTVSAINGNTLTLNRNLLYYSEVGSLVVQMQRDIVIKACKTDGTEVPDGDQDSARVFFNVEYWTSNSWNNAPTRRVKIKYVRFKGLGYNTNNSTNFRAGVTIGGYNGHYRTDLTGSSADSSTVHTSSGSSQTGENYVDGCAISCYNLTSNSTRDGDTYPSLCIRHPYGHVDRNNAIIGTGRGYWRWSTGYHVKSTGFICWVGNYCNTQTEAMYDTGTLEYFHMRMSEDYGIMIYNVRMNNMLQLRHIDIAQQNRTTYFNQNMNLIIDRFKASRYLNLYVEHSNSGVIFTNSQIYPNTWDGSNALYNGVAGIHQTYINPTATGHGDMWRKGSGEQNVLKFYEHGFKSNEYLELHHRVARLKMEGNSDWEVVVGNDSRANLFDNIWVPANTQVKVQSKIYVNPKTYLGSASSLSNSSYPYLIAKPWGGDMSMGRQTTGEYITSTGGQGFDDGYVTNNYFGSSTAAQGKLYTGFLEAAAHTSASMGAWEQKEVTVAPQKQGYMLTYGFVWDSDNLREEGMKMKDFKVALSKASSQPASIAHGSQASVRSSFTSGKKRIGGTRL